MKYFSIILFLSILISCQEEVVLDVPLNLMNQEEMIDVMVDIQVLESHYHNIHQRPNVYANALDSASYFIFKSHGITKSIFEENLNYYVLQPDTLFSIYESALDTVNNRINSGIKR
jgi:hypothetical protein